MNETRRAAVAAVVALVVAVGTWSAASPPRPKVKKTDIVETAAAAGTFKTLAAALQAAGLVDTLKGPGPFTLFAPTDSAFAKLPAGTVESLLLPENKDRLVALLTYHVVPGKVAAVDAARRGDAKTVNGQKLSIKGSGSGLKVDDANVVEIDIQCTNGVIHVIDAVLHPRS